MISMGLYEDIKIGLKETILYERGEGEPYSVTDISRALRSVREFKSRCRRDGRLLTVDDIEDLIDNIDVIEYYLKLHKELIIRFYLNK